MLKSIQLRCLGAVIIALFAANANAGFDPRNPNIFKRLGITPTDHDPKDLSTVAANAKKNFYLELQTESEKFLALFHRIEIKAIEQRWIVDALMIEQAYDAVLFSYSQSKNPLGMVPPSNDAKFLKEVEEVFEKLFIRKNKTIVPDFTGQNLEIIRPRAAGAESPGVRKGAPHPIVDELNFHSVYNAFQELGNLKHVRDFQFDLLKKHFDSAPQMSLYLWGNLLGSLNSEGRYGKTYLKSEILAFARKVTQEIRRDFHSYSFGKLEYVRLLICHTTNYLEEHNPAFYKEVRDVSISAFRRTFLLHGGHTENTAFIAENLKNYTWRHLRTFLTFFGKGYFTEESRIEALYALLEKVFEKLGTEPVSPVNASNFLFPLEKLLPQFDPVSREKFADLLIKQMKENSLMDSRRFLESSRIIATIRPEALLEKSIFTKFIDCMNKLADAETKKVVLPVFVQINGAMAAILTKVSIHAPNLAEPQNLNFTSVQKVLKNLQESLAEHSSQPQHESHPYFYANLWKVSVEEGLDDFCKKLVLTEITLLKDKGKK